MPVRPTTRPRARLRASQVLGGGAVIGALVLGSAYSAHAEPQGPSQEQVDNAKADVAMAGQEAAALDQQYAAAAAALVGLRQRAAAFAEAANGAKWELEQATIAAAEARRAANAAHARATSARADLRAYAAAIYQQGGTLATFAPILDAGDPQELIDRASALELVGARQDDRLTDALQISGTAESLERAAASAEAARAAASEKAVRADRVARDELAMAGAQASRLSSQRTSLAQRLATLRDTSARLEKQRLDAIAKAAEAQADQNAPADTDPAPTTHTSNSTTTQTPTGTSTTHPTSSSTTTRPTSTSTSTRPTSTSTTTRPTSTSTTTRPTSTSTTPTSTTTTPKSTSTSTPAPPPPATGAAAAIAYAQAQIGKPYEWGAEGPDTFDCSGLTMMAWRQAGVYLSHYTGAQWAETSRVSIDQLAPGDLVFFGSSGPTSHHMGLYVGGGQMIEAPYTGAYVRYASIYRSDLLPYGGRVG